MKSHISSRGRFLASMASLLLAAGLWSASAQTISRHDRLSPLAKGYLERARIMIEDGNYAGVIDQLKHLDTQNVTLAASEREDCAYLLAMALYERGDAGCVDLLRDFAENWPASPQALPARLAAADYFFYSHKFSDALAAYREIDFARINPGDRPTYDYRLALSLLETGHPDEALPIFNSLRGNRKFSLAADYYIAYTEYLAGNYDSAYAAFSEVEAKVADNPVEGIHPLYYLAQIDYARGNYREAAARGQRLIKEDPVEELLPETRRIVGLSLFKTGDYDGAARFLTDYVKGEDHGVAADAIYALGVIAYRDGDMATASRRFSSLTDLNNDLAQSAYLYLGQIAVSENDPDAAAISFEKAAKMDFDPAVTETALFNYIAARTHGGNIPFSSSVNLLNEFLGHYPNSRFAPKLREYLATAYYNEKDYARALESINRIPNPSRDVVAAKQKILYELGMQEMAANRPAAAARYLSEAASIGQDGRLRAEINLWLGDALYAQKKYAAAENAYEASLKGDRSSDNRAQTLYNLAYAQLWQDKYKAAASSFASALKASPSLPERLRSDATVRRADALYYAGDYRQATRLYTEVIESGASEADYATYRRAVMYGLAGDINMKLSELAALPKRFPGSNWIAAALLETGQTHSGLGETSKAVAAFEQLRKSHSESAQARKGMINLAMTYMKAGDSRNGVKTYREVISRWPSSEEASLANEDLRKYYAENGGVEEYAEFLRGVRGAPQINPSEIESLAFEGAETAFGDNVTDISRLEKYVEQYPDGRHLSQALLDIATGREELDDFKGALDALNTLLNRRGDSSQVPEALQMKARLIEEQGLGSREDAERAWRELERRGGNDYLADAYAGIMRTTDRDSERLRYARLVKRSSGLSADQVEEAEFYEGSAMLGDGNAQEGIGILRRLAANPNSLSGAKAAVTLGQHLLDSGDVAGAEKVLSEFTDAGTSQEYWLARGFIALADVCHARGKDYIAVEYLKSLRANYPGKELDIHDMIATRLSEWKSGK